jgi:hypothetical protein
MSGLVSLLFFHVVFRLADETCTGKMIRPTLSLRLTTTPSRHSSSSVPQALRKHDSPPAPLGSRISKKCVANIGDP